MKPAGTGADDQVKGGHPDVVVNSDRVYLFYFTHPGRVDSIPESSRYEKRRSSIQVVELKYENGWIIWDRDEPTYIKLSFSSQ